MYVAHKNLFFEVQFFLNASRTVIFPPHSSHKKIQILQTSILYFRSRIVTAGYRYQQVIGFGSIHSTRHTISTWRLLVTQRMHIQKSCNDLACHFSMSSSYKYNFSKSITWKLLFILPVISYNNTIIPWTWNCKHRLPLQLWHLIHNTICQFVNRLRQHHHRHIAICNHFKSQFHISTQFIIHHSSIRRLNLSTYQFFDWALDVNFHIP